MVFNIFAVVFLKNIAEIFACFFEKVLLITYYKDTFSKPCEQENTYRKQPRTLKREKREVEKLTEYFINL